jgi:hypothetical protein
LKIHTFLHEANFAKTFQENGYVNFGNHVLQTNSCKHWWDYETSWKFQLEFPINENTWKIDNVEWMLSVVYNE